MQAAAAGATNRMLTRARWAKVAHATRSIKSELEPVACNGALAVTRHISRRRPRDIVSRARANCTGHRDSPRDATKHMTRVIQEYEGLASKGTLLFDPLQRRAAQKLTRLQLALRDYDHSAFLEQLERAEHYEEEERRREADDEQKEVPILEEMPPPVPVPRGFVSCSVDLR